MLSKSSTIISTERNLLSRAYKARNVTYKDLKNTLKVVYNNFSRTRDDAPETLVWQKPKVQVVVICLTGKKFANPALKSSAEIGYNYFGRTKDFVSGLENIEN